MWRANEDESQRFWEASRRVQLEELQDRRYEEVSQKRKQEQGERHIDAMHHWRSAAEHEQQNEESWRHRSGTVTYRSVHDVLFTKEMGGLIKHRPQRVGSCVFTTGNEWRGPQGGLWVQASKSESLWYLVQGPGFGVDGPCLVNEAGTLDHLQISVNFVSTAGDFRVLDTFMPQSNTVRSLRKQLCEQTQLKPRGTIILSRSEKRCADSKELDGAPVPIEAIGPVVSTPEVLEDSRTLASYKLGQRATLYLLYNYEFAADYLGGSSNS